MQFPEESPNLSSWPHSRIAPEIDSNLDPAINPDTPIPIPRGPISPIKNPRLSVAFTEAEFENQQEQQGFHRGPTGRRKGRVLMIFSWTAAFMDALTIVGISMIFLASFFLVDKHYQFGIAKLVFADSIFWVGLFLMLSFIYMIMLRSVLGFTLGEWACSLRMGTTLERISKYYPLRVLLRTFVLFATGVVVLPFLSLCFGRDLVGSLCRVRLNSLK